MKKTVFVFGAGSTVCLNIPATNEQNKIIKEIEKYSENDLLLKLKKILDGTFENEYTINDVYNIIDSNILLKNALQCGEIRIEYYQLEECKKELIKCIFNVFLNEIISRDEKYYKKIVKFYYDLAKYEINDKYNKTNDFKNRESFISDYSIINFNWDLYSLIPIIEANGKLNREKNFIIEEEKKLELRMYTDFNCEFASKDNDNSKLWYPFTEGAAYVVNDGEKYDSKRRVVLTKCFYPHGAMNLFKCTACAKHSYYLGKLELSSIASSMNYVEHKKIYNCPYCNNQICGDDFDILAQSNFKVRNSFLEETRLSMINELRTAKRLFFIGYSMPNDDIDNITMFKSLNKSVEEVYVVLYNEKSQDKFVEYKELNDDIKKEVKNFYDCFKSKKILFNMGGFPTSVDSILEYFKK